MICYSSPLPEGLMMERTSKHWPWVKQKERKNEKKEYLCNLSCSLNIDLIIVTESKNKNKEYLKVVGFHWVRFSVSRSNYI